MELTAQQYCWLLAHVLTQPAEPPPKQVPAGQRTVSWFEDVHVCPFSLQTSLLLPLKQVNTVQPLSSQVPLRHFCPLPYAGQSVSAQHSLQGLFASVLQRFPTIVTEDPALLVYVRAQYGAA